MKQLEGADPVAVGKYRTIAELGRGGMGRVLLSSAPDGRLVALKQVRSQFVEDDGSGPVPPGGGSLPQGLRSVYVRDHRRRTWMPPNHG